MKKTNKKQGERRMKQKLKRSILTMVAIVLCGIMYMTFSNVSLAATEAGSAQKTEQTAEVYKASQDVVVYPEMRGMAKVGDYLYYASEKGLVSVNIKTNSTRYVDKGADYTQLISYQGYLYYTRYKYIYSKKTGTGHYKFCSVYRIKAGKKTKPELVCKNGRLSIIKNDVILYTNNDYLCSCSLDGSHKKKCYKFLKNDMQGYLIYKNGRYYFGDPNGMYTVDKNFKDRRKSKKDAYGMICEAYNYTFSSSSVEMDNGGAYVKYNEKKKKWGVLYWTQTSETTTKEKYIYIAKKKHLYILNSSKAGYLMIVEYNKDLDWRAPEEDKCKAGTVKIIDIKGHVIGTVKKKYLL